MKFRISFIHAIIIFSLFILTFCSRGELTDWERAAKFVKYHSSENYLNHIDPVFKKMEGGHKASGWLNYFFSPLSTRNWVNEDEEYAAYSREPVIPRGIVFRNTERDPEVTGKQLVISVDESGWIIVKGYEKDNDDLVFEDKWKFPEIN